LASGLGAATADASYGAVAAFGLTALSAALTAVSIPLRLFGGLFLAYLGYKAFVAPAVERAGDPDMRQSLFASWASVAALTIVNPATVLAFLSAFAGIGATTAGADVLSALLMVTGVFFGSAAWWLILSTAVSLFRARIDARAMRWINRFSGAVLIAFALRILWQLVSGA
jgi:threonine/homoserine/homoserine lactone efflux protein